MSKLINNTIQNKIINALNNGKIKLVGGKKKWFNFVLNIQELSWARNNQDGYSIDVLTHQEHFLFTAVSDSLINNGEFFVQK